MLLIALALVSTPAISQDIIYGLTRFGGQHNKGVLYQIRTTGEGYLSYKDFDGNPSDRPGYWSRLTQLSITSPLVSENSFAGLTEYGNIANFGADVGSRFDFKAANANVTQGGKLYFGEGSGKNPTGGLLSALGMFYGTIPNGGSNNDGVLYAVQQIMGNGQQTVGEFHGPVTGRSPKGTPILASNGALYGMAEFGGANDAGVPVYIFFDQSGKRLATSLAMPDGGNIGHPATPEEIKAFVGLLEKTAPRMTTAQRQQVADYLAKQKY